MYTSFVTNHIIFLIDIHCREWYFHNLIKNNTEIDYENDFNNNIFLDEAHFDDDDND